MATQYAVLHTEKGKSSGGGLGHHIDRTDGMVHTYPHADPARKDLNQNFPVYRGRETWPLSQAIAHRIEEGYQGKKGIRKDAVRYLSTVLTGSHQRMMEISKDPEELKAWVASNYKFACDEFGKENIVRFTLHMDEKTPHIHCVHVPLTADGRLSAKAVLGDRIQLKERQSLYAELMKKFKLNRGQSREGVFHETAQEYYRRINITEDLVENLEVNGIFGLQPNKTLKKTNEALKTALMALQKKEREVSNLQESSARTKRSLAQKESELSKSRKLFLEFVNDPEKRRKLLELVERDKKEKKEKLEKEKLEKERKEKEKAEKLRKDKRIPPKKNRGISR